MSQRTNELQKHNLLIKCQAEIELQSSELQYDSEKLRTANELLIQKQKLFEVKTEQLQKTNEELMLLNSTKDKLCSVIAHDLRNPFYVISGFSEILLKEFRHLPPEKIERFISLIYATSKNGNHLLETLLDWSKAGRMQFYPVPVSFPTVAEDTIDFLQGDIQIKNLQVKTAIEPSLTVMADENMLKTILRNLLSNAIKFTQENGSITIITKTKEPSVEITITDTGIGIKKDRIQNLFTPDDLTFGQKTGNGIGLMICKEFVEKHHGKIWVESEEGKGSSFIFTIPLN